MFLNKLQVLFIICCIFFISSEEAFGDISIFWNDSNFSEEDGASKKFSQFYNQKYDSHASKPIILTVLDSEFAGNQKIDTIEVDLEWIRWDEINRKVLTLVEDKSDSGFFQNKNLVVMQNVDIAMQIDQTINFQFYDSLVVNGCESVDLLLLVSSDSEQSFISLPLKKITPYDDIQRFNSEKLNFSISNSNNMTNTLLVNQGDVFTAFVTKNPASPNHDKCANNDQILAMIHGLIVPNLNSGTDYIFSKYTPASITATYKTESTSIHLSSISNSGRYSSIAATPGGEFGNTSGNTEGALSGTGCRGDCTPPTLGVNNIGAKFVEKGFQYNNWIADVKYYYTPMDLITVKIGEMNKAVLKIYDNFGPEEISHVELGFGLGKGETINESKASIIWDKSWNGTEYVTQYDPDNVLDNVFVQTEIGSCGISYESQCLIVTVDHMFRDYLLFNMVSTNVWDFRNNAWQNYYNHGIDITGESLNPAKTIMVGFGEKEMRGLYQLIQVDKKNDTWIDEFGNIYEHKGNNRFDRIYDVPKKFIYDVVTKHGCDRNCNWFEEYKLNEELLAKRTLEKMLNGKPIKNKGMLESFSYEYSTRVSRSDDLQLQKTIELEIKKASELFDKIN